MSEPRRLKDETRDRLALALLASIDGDGPDPGARHRAEVALGLAGGALAGAAGGASFGALKWLGLGLLGAAVIFGSIALAPIGVPSPVEGEGESTLENAVQPEDPSPTEDSPPESTAPTPEPPPPASRPSAKSAASPKAPSIRRASLLEQMAIIDAARAALAAREPARALGLLDDLDRRFPQGAFREEATVLRIEAFRAAGEPGRAETLALQFLEANPKSAYARRVRSGLR